MSGHSYLTYYDQMPIPADLERTLIIPLGDVAVGIQFRELRDDIVAQQNLEKASGATRGKVENLDDVGVALHVFDCRNNTRVEILRFDCFDDEPHYHYVNWDDRRNEVAWLDPVVVGDPLLWSLRTLATRLPVMIEYALGADHGIVVDQKHLDTKLPEIAAAAHAARVG